MNISYILFETLTFVLYFPIVYVTFADMWVRRVGDRKKYYMHLMILWNSAQTSKEIRKYLTIVNIFVSNAK